MIDSVTFINLEYFFLLIYNVLTGNNETSWPAHLIVLWGNFKVISTIFSLLLLTGMVYSLIRIRQIRKEEEEVYATKAPPQRLGRDNERFEHIRHLVSSENPNDWRQAVLEADILLDDLVTKLGYPGENLGERLRGIEKADFTTIDEAWSGHKVRNQIAHQGSEFILTQREARRVIGLYQKVFEEFYYI